MFSVLPSDETLEKMFFISQRLVDGIEMDDILDYIIQTTILITNADAVAIRDFDIESGKLKIIRAYGLSEIYLSKSSIQLGEGIIGHVVADSKPFVHADITRVMDCNNRAIFREEGIRSVVSVPLKGKEMSTGCITVARKKVDPFSTQEIFLLKMFGLQVCEAIKILKLVDVLQKQTMHDCLTHIYNKNALNVIFEKNLSLAKRHLTEMSIIFIDIDNFKHFNDTHGHLLGDKLLFDFAQVLKKFCRKSDSIGRFGGEEFVILAPETDKKQAVEFANKLRRIIENKTFIGKGDHETTITFSAGVSSFPEDGDMIFDLLKKADKAMYQSKIAGRNRVTPWTVENNLF
ncbi:diguanylate cyclase [Pelosinus sp. sgz500959]|uniref:sensor domain-containing diguanylate cyclase n=1 Tax=Pelosinus sp. sgz500959 TaxID=3242472 RepID=UPI00366BED74